MQNPPRKLTSIPAKFSGITKMGRRRMRPMSVGPLRQRQRRASCGAAEAASSTAFQACPRRLKRQRLSADFEGKRLLGFDATPVSGNLHRSLHAMAETDRAGTALPGLLRAATWIWSATLDGDCPSSPAKFQLADLRRGDQLFRFGHRTDELVKPTASLPFRRHTPSGRSRGSRCRTSSRRRLPGPRR